MKIETLPLLSSDFATWTWWGTNGEASESAVNRSYLALENKDLCSNFIREVWNDLVKLLNNALTTAGFQWDSAYGDLDSTLFDTSLRINREFKASMFNAVVLNINQLGIFHWNWERTNNIPGFLGRTYMRGYAEYGSASDYIYGWYILELAKKLNEFIKVLQDAAPFKEYEGTGTPQTINTSLLTAGSAGAFESLLKGETDHIAPLAIVRIIENSSICTEYSYHKGIIVSINPLILPESLQQSNSYIKASTDRAKVQDYETNAHADTFSGSVLRGNPFISRMIYQKPIQVKYLAGVDAFNIQELVYVNKALTKLEAYLYNAMPYLLNMTGNAVSHDNVELVLAESLLMNAGTRSDSHAISELILRDKKIMSSINASFSKQISNMSYIVPLYMQRKIHAESYYMNEMDMVLPQKIEKSDYALSYASAAAGAYETISMKKELRSCSCGECSVNAIQIKYFNPYAVEADTFPTGVINIVQGVFTETSEKSQSFTDVEILNGIPLLIESYLEERSNAEAKLKALGSILFGNKDVSRTQNNAELSRYHSGALNGKYKAYSKAVCVLELESTIISDWYDPVQNGTDLYVRNAYPQWKEGSNVHLDSSGEFYEPVQTDRNVYIRSNESMKGW